MAQKRMFDKDVIGLDSFLDLPMEAKGLYFLLGMEADDEGFVNPKKVVRLYGGSEDSIKLLIVKGFLIPFQSGVVVITDWRRNNYLDKKRIKQTIYQDEKSQIEYESLSQRYQCLTDVKQMLRENRIEQNSIEQNSIVYNNNNNNIYSKKTYGEFKNVLLTDEEYKKLKEKNLLPLIETLSSYMASKGKKYKSHYATILTWNRKEKKEKNNIDVEYVIY